MIALMRTRAAKWVARILAVFLIVAFAAWGIEDMFRIPSGTENVAQVAETSISRQEFSSQFSRLMNAMRARVGPDFGAQQAVQLGLADQTLDQMINARLISIEAHRLGLDAGEDLIRQTILNDERFHGIGDRFDRNLFQNLLRREGMPESAYVATLREQILRDQLTGALAQSARVTDAMLNTIYEYRNERRIADVVVIPLGKTGDIPDPSDTTLAEFHGTNPGLFTAPEYRNVVAIYLDPNEVAKNLSPAEDRIRQEFEHRKQTLSIPERRTVEQAVLTDEEKAKALSAALKQGRPFAEAVRETTGREPTVLRRVSRNDIPDTAIAEAAFSLPRDTASEPVKSVLGWHVLRITGIDPGKDATFARHREKIRDDLAREMAVDDIIQLTGKLDDTLATAAPLEEAAAAVGTRLLSFEIDANGKDPSGRTPEGMPDSPEFLERAFAAPVGEVSNVEETRNGGFFVLRVDRVIPPAIRPLSKVRARAVEEWKKSRLHSAAKAKAETLQQAAKAAGSLARAANTGEHRLVTSEPFSRFNRDPSSPVSAELSTALFNARPGEIVVESAKDGYGVASVTKILAADPGKNREEAQNLRAELRSAIEGDIVAQYLAALRQRYTVTRFPAAVESVTGVSSGG